LLADLLERIYARDELATLDPASRRLALREILAEENVVDLATAVRVVADEIDGYGPISDLMSDDLTSDILINGPSEIWTERDGAMTRVDRAFESVDHLRSWCERHVCRAGGRIDAAAPMADVRLPDGARMHAVLPPIAPNGPLVSIRRFPRQPHTLDALVASGSMSMEDKVTLESAVGTGRSVVVSGATGTGKTTLLGVLLGLVPDHERVVVIEELPELNIAGDNKVSLTGRGPNAEGRGQVTLETLVRASLRMRPDRIVVGEVRGAEALPALWAMSTGHAGSLLSIHASSAQDARSRLVDLALMSDRAPSEESLKREVARAVDLWVHLVRRQGRRVVDQIDACR
jgi:pilus assembly protein CpaF